MAWTYKPGRVTVIVFVVLSLVAGYAAQVLIKQEFLSGISSCVVFDKNNKVYFEGVLLSVVNDKNKETQGWILNPLESWKIPVLLFGVFIAIGAIIIFYKSRLMLLEREKAEHDREIADFREIMRRKDSQIAEQSNELRFKSAEVEKQRSSHAQYKASYEAMSLENTTMKEQCNAALVKKDREFAAKAEDMCRKFAATILTMGEKWNVSSESDENTI
jgi:hypothetical protein